MIRGEKWFLARIGKRVYRDAGTCDCESCRDTEKNGLIVADKFHAKYMAMMEADLANCGEIYNYRDKK